MYGIEAKVGRVGPVGGGGMVWLGHTLSKRILYFGPGTQSKPIFVSWTLCQIQYKLDFSDEKQ